MTTFPSLFSLILFISTTLCLNKAFSLTGLPLMNAYASKDGIVKLHKFSYGVSYGYYAYVDFEYLKDDGSDSEELIVSPNTGQMMIGLYTSQTWLSSNCMDFTTYDCSANYCTRTQSTTYAYLPYIYAQGNYATADAYLDYNNWYLSQSAVIATSCSSSGNYNYGIWRTGILGMGVQSNSNFKGNELFTIYLDNDTSYGGELTFSLNQDRIASNSTPFTLIANTNWEINLGSGYFYFYGSSTQSQYLYSQTMIFDLDSPTIGLPYAIYNNFISYLTLATGLSLSCNTNNIYPTCSYSGTLGSLPNISLYTQSQQIFIPPQVYLKDGFSYDSSTYLTNLTLNIRALSSIFSGPNYVTSNYNNYIIMGSSFMTYYYTKFDNTQAFPQITLYVSSGVMPGSGLLWLWIVLGVAGFILIITCCVCCCKKAKMSQTGAKVAPTDQAPLMTNTDGTNYQYNQAQPTYDGYNNGNYYQQQNYGYGYPQDDGNAYAQQPQGYNPYTSN